MRRLLTRYVRGFLDFGDVTIRLDRSDLPKPAFRVPPPEPEVPLLWQSYLKLLLN